MFLKLKKLFKYFEYFQIKIIQSFKQKKYVRENIKLKYIFEKSNSSKELIVIFSACTRNGVKARYNYVRTLKKSKKNKLFILDDFGDDRRGEYYLGEAPDFKVEIAVKELIDKYIFLHNIEKVYFIGSSKGGFAAINFGTMYDNSKIIVGAPQFYLGRYLSSDAYKTTFYSMKLDEQWVNFLNEKLINQLMKASTNIEIYIHYSPNEHTYQEHIKDLITVLEKYNIKFYEDIQSYTNHGDVSLYFPKYLLKVIREERFLDDKNINGWQ